MTNRQAQVIRENWLKKELVYREDAILRWKERLATESFYAEDLYEMRLQIRIWKKEIEEIKGGKW